MWRPRSFPLTDCATASAETGGRHQKARAAAPKRKPTGRCEISLRVTPMDDYLDDLPPAEKVALERVRTVVGGLAPDAEEGTSYGVPAFIYAGRPLLGFSAAKTHLSLFPFSPAAIDAVREQLRRLRPRQGHDPFLARQAGAGGRPRRPRSRPQAGDRDEAVMSSGHLPLFVPCDGPVGRCRAAASDLPAHRVRVLDGPHPPAQLGQHDRRALARRRREFRCRAFRCPEPWLGRQRGFRRLRAALRGADRTFRKMKRCEEKIRYRTAAGATWSLWGIWLDRYLRGRRHRRERRACACPHCDGWHLTSQSKRRRSTGRRH